MREETEEIAALSANLAFIYDVQGDYGKAEEYYRKALEIVGKSWVRSIPIQRRYTTTWH